MIPRRIRSQIALQKDKIALLEEELKTKQNKIQLLERP